MKINQNILYDYQQEILDLKITLNQFQYMQLFVLSKNKRPFDKMVF